LAQGSYKASSQTISHTSTYSVINPNPNPIAIFKFRTHSIINPNPLAIP
jgi:hypothetical protein